MFEKDDTLTAEAASKEDENSSRLKRGTRLGRLDGFTNLEQWLLAWIICALLVGRII